MTSASSTGPYPAGQNRYRCTGVILAGGKNSRLPGKKKTLRHIGETTMLERIFSLFSRIFEETILVVNDPKDFLGPDALVVTDILPSRCALAGLHTGIFYASCPWVYATACDVPFINEKVIRHLLSCRRSGIDVIVPRTNEGMEPLAALYTKGCLPSMEKNLKENRFMITKAFRPKRVLEVPIAELAHLDPQMRFKFNVNTPQDLETARAMAEQENTNQRS